MLYFPKTIPEHVNYLCNILDREHQFLSFVEKENPAYKALVDFGVDAIPTLITHIKTSGQTSWFVMTALQDIVGQSFVLDKKDLGNNLEISQAWLRWYAAHFKEYI